MSNLVTSINEGANAWDIFMNVVSVVSSVLEGVQSALDAVNTIQEILGVTTEATSAI
jgi:hypothetical protein